MARSSPNQPARAVSTAARRRVRWPSARTRAPRAVRERTLRRPSPGSDPRRGPAPGTPLQAPPRPAPAHRHHGLLDEGFDRLLGGAGPTRRHWQALTALQSGPATVQELDATLAPFLDDRDPTTRPVLDDLAARGWATWTADDRAAATPADAPAADGQPGWPSWGMVRRTLAGDPATIV